MSRSFFTSIKGHSLHVAAQAEGAGDAWRTNSCTISAVGWIASEISADTSAASTAGRAYLSAGSAMTRIC